MGFLQKSKRKLSRRLHSWRHRYLDNYLFIHINKTGGSSIKKALGLPFEHKTAMEKMAEMGAQRWSRRYRFTVVRNPWDKVVSHYHFRVQTNRTNLGEAPIPFIQWVQRTYGEQDPTYYNNPRMFMPQCDWICDPQGQVMVDDICRFERLNEDFADVCAKISMPGMTLPHVKASSRGPYRDYYDAQTRDIVARWFARDIELLGYSF